MTTLFAFVVATAAAPAAIALRDIHEPPAPGWWPPAPGWWVLAMLLLLVPLFWWAHHQRRARHWRAMVALFDTTVADAASPTARIAAMSELLRRAARTRDPAADRLQGDDWLAFLDQGLEGTGFSSGAGRALLDAAYRPDIGDIDIDALHALSRARFVSWMAPR